MSFKNRNTLIWWYVLSACYIFGWKYFFFVLVVLKNSDYFWRVWYVLSGGRRMGSQNFAFFTLIFINNNLRVKLWEPFLKGPFLALMHVVLSRQYCSYIYTGHPDATNAEDDEKTSRIWTIIEFIFVWNVCIGIVISVDEYRLKCYGKWRFIFVRVS